jgi:hypothetical protein
VGRCSAVHCGMLTRTVAMVVLGAVRDVGIEKG